MSEIALRAYVTRAEPIKKSNFKRNYNLRFDRILVFDTETTIEGLNFKVGYFQIYQDDKLQFHGIFYDKEILQEFEVNTIKNYCSKSNIELFELKEFVDKVFYREAFNLQTLIAGYHLAFDIARLMIKYGDSRKTNRGGFTFTLSEKPYFPPIIIKRLNESNTFKFQGTKWNQGENYFSGNFLDIQKLAEVLLESRHIPLVEACKKLNTPAKKMEDIEHGTITTKYLRYLVTDVVSTYQVFRALIKELDIYNIDVSPVRIFSSASIAKGMLRQMNIKSFSIQNPEFSSELKGNIMTSYFGGRSECKIRKKPVIVDVLDFTSMYPTLNILMNFWKLTIADHIEMEDVTNEIRELIETITPEDLRKKETLEKLNVIVLTTPEDDILPIRTNYQEKNFTLGINYLSSTNNFWFALPDIISAKLLNKVPKILKAIRFKPIGVQTDLKTINILGMNIDPLTDNPIKMLVEERQRIKEELKSLVPTDPRYKILQSRAQAIKIVVNSVCYGIFLELNPEEEETPIQVHGLDTFNTSKNYYEKEGEYFNPIIGTIITSGARLMLALAEQQLKQLHTTHIYMDTDAVFVQPKASTKLIEFFKPLSPYNQDIELLKRETHKQGVLFYGISSKRYALYTLKKSKIRFLDLEDEESFKLHGLAHIINPYPSKTRNWLIDVWTDILKLHYKKTMMANIQEKYALFFELSKLTLTTPQLLDIYQKLNDGKALQDQVKPFDFKITGTITQIENHQPVRPIGNVDKNPQSIVHKPFIDANTGEIKQGIKYFKPLSQTITEYINHPEHKSEGNIGILKRKHINATKIIYIGKEIRDIEKEPIIDNPPQIFINDNELIEEMKKWITENKRPSNIEKTAYNLFKKRLLNGEIKYLSTKIARQITEHMKVKNKISHSIKSETLYT